MVAKKSFKWAFGGVAVWAKDNVFLIGQHESMIDQDHDDAEPVSYIFRWNGDFSSRPVPMFATSVCVTADPEPTVLFMGRNGAVIRASKTIDFVPEAVDGSDEGPQTIGDLREVRAIGHSAYVCGMGRTVYRSTSGDKWARIDQGVRETGDMESDAGFNTLHGFSEQEIYAGGWNGELWLYDGNSWSALASPTHLALMRIVCAPDGKVYAGAQAGTLVIGRGSTWTTLELDDTRHDITGVCYFKGSLFLATLDALYRLSGTTFTPVALQSAGKKIKTSPGVCCGFLDCNEEVIWSVGPRMVVYSQDGVSWTETSY